jgi:antirestriction protein
MSTQTSTTPRIWIGCLAAYNNGDLHGRWVDADDADKIERVRDEVLQTSPVCTHGGHAEEYAVMDYDGFGSLSTTLGEWPDFEILAAIAQEIEKHGPAFTAYIEACEPTLDKDLANGFEDAYRGEWDNEQDYAEHEITELGFAGVQLIPEELLSYLDMNKVTREIFRHGTMQSHENPTGGIYAFDTAA